MEQDLVTFIFFRYFAGENQSAIEHGHNNTDNYG